MKTLFKWIVIVWSLFCLVGILIGLSNIAQHAAINEAHQGAYALGTALGLGIWVIVWLAIAGPAYFLFRVSGRKKPLEPPDHEPVMPCPLCAETIKAAAKKCRFCGHYLG